MSSVVLYAMNIQIGAFSAAVSIVSNILREGRQTQPEKAMNYQHAIWSNEALQLITASKVFSHWLSDIAAYNVRCTFKQVIDQSSSLLLSDDVGWVVRHVKSQSTHTCGGQMKLAQ
jgi:hypothetical protein